jgi:1,4-alpha-glucan branching enzyme
MSNKKSPSVQKKAPIKKVIKKVDLPSRIATHKMNKTTVNEVIFHSLFTENDIALFQGGAHFNLYKLFGAHKLNIDSIEGIYFAVWAPNAKSVSVVGDFNLWNPASSVLFPRWDKSGIWEGFIPNCRVGEVYKYSIETIYNTRIEKADPFGFFWELRPKTATITTDVNYKWNDRDWMKNRVKKNSLVTPVSVYEVHLGSWMRNKDDNEKYLSYKEVAILLADYVLQMGFTHIELMPVMEHPFDGSWGYQITGYFAPSARFGEPDDFMFFMDYMHQQGIGVFLDWVPAHFPSDAHGLHKFDGTHLYEHEDVRKGFHPDWKTYIFNLGRSEVKSFLLSNAIFWLDCYHADGFRVDAVASMLHLNYSRKEGEWLPNHLGGSDNLDSVSFFKELNTKIKEDFPNVLLIAEESTTWPGVTKSVADGGLGFDMKWMMGWMNDTLKYFERDPYYRQYHQNDITFSLIYAFSENFMLPFSHDEVVHGKKPMLYKMPGDEWQRFANLRLMYFWMYTHPGTKLLFMGCEFGQTSEWNFERSLEWHLLKYDTHKKLQTFVKELNNIYKMSPALYQKSFVQEGFEWIDASNYEQSILIFMRKGAKVKDTIVVAMNLTPIPRETYRIGLPFNGKWKEVFSSDSLDYFGSGLRNEFIHVEKVKYHNQLFSAEVTLPPLGGIIIKC